MESLSSPQPGLNGGSLPDGHRHSDDILATIRGRAQPGRELDRHI